MINNVSSMDARMYPQASIKTRTHNRTNELYAHRNAITAASQSLVYAVQNGDAESIKLCNDVIDDAQKRINEIINQEDEHASQVFQDGKNIAHTIVETGKDLAPMISTQALTPHLDLTA